jgi:hypothetical protein
MVCFQESCLRGNAFVNSFLEMVPHVTLYEHILPLLEYGEGNNDKMYKWKREEKYKGRTIKEINIRENSGMEERVWRKYFNVKEKEKENETNADKTNEQQG